MSDKPKSSLNSQAEDFNRLFQAAKKYRATHRDAQYKQVAEYLWGDQEIRRGVSDSQNDFVTNYVYRDYNLAVSMMARDKPNVELQHLLAEKNVEDLAKKQVNYVLNKNDSIEITEQVSGYGLSYGRAYTKVTWDPKLRGGLGDIHIAAVDPRCVYLMPGVGRLKGALVIFEAHRMDALTALHLLPDHKAAINELFKKAKDEQEEEYYIPFADSDGSVRASVDEGQTYSESQSHIVDVSKGYDESKADITIVEAWSYDERTLEMLPELFDEVKKKKTEAKREKNRDPFAELDEDETANLGQTKLYPRGQCTLLCGDHLFESKPNPLPCFPYAEFFNLNMPVSKPGDELGVGEWDQLLEIQDSYNVRFNQIMDAMDSMALGGWGLYEESSGVDVDEMDSSPMGWYSCYAVDKVKWFPVVPIGSEAFHSLKELKGNFEDITGRQEILQADMPGDLRSGAAIEELSQLAFGVMKPRTHHLEICLHNTVEIIIRMIGFFYKNHYHYEAEPPEGFEGNPEEYEPLRGLGPDEFEIYIKAGLNLPSSEQAKQGYYLKLLEMEVVDNEFVRDNSELPNKEAVKARMAEKEKAAAEAQQQAMEMEMQLKQNEMQLKESEIQIKMMELQLKERELEIKAEQGERNATAAYGSSKT